MPRGTSESIGKFNFRKLCTIIFIQGGRKFRLVLVGIDMNMATEIFFYRLIEKLFVSGIHKNLVKFLVTCQLRANVPKSRLPG